MKEVRVWPRPVEPKPVASCNGSDIESCVEAVSTGFMKPTAIICRHMQCLGTLVTYTFLCHLKCSTLTALALSASKRYVFVLYEIEKAEGLKGLLSRE